MNVFLFLFTLLVQNHPNYCSCIPLGPLDDKQYNEYNLIAKGKIVNVIVNNSERIIYLEVETYYKGKQTQANIEIGTPSQEGVCGILPKVGENWLMFAYADEKNYKTSLCTRTKNMNPKAWDYQKDELAEDIKFLTEKITNKSH